MYNYIRKEKILYIYSKIAMTLFNKRIFCLFLIGGVALSVLVSSHKFYDLKTGDLNLDGKIDILDLNLLQHTLLQKNSIVSVGDQNGDNKVDVIDLQILFNRLEKKWQGKIATSPIDFLHAPVKITSNTLQKTGSINLFSSFNKETEHKPSPLLVTPKNKGHKPKTELQFLTGFLCHAPPAC